MPPIANPTSLKAAAAAVLAAAMMASCKTEEKPGAYAKPPPPRSKQTNDNLLKPGDSIELFVMEDASFNGAYKVREKGDIILPKVGRIAIEGLTIESAQAKIQTTLKSNQLTQATVIADRIGTGGFTTFSEAPKVLVFVTGKVSRPGQHMIAIKDGEAIYAYEAIMIAGGTTPFADERKAYILRRGAQGARQRISLDLRAIRQGSASDVPLAEGDMICVPERRFAL